LFYDDDLQSSALSDTGIFKKLVTATIPFLVERKGEPHYEMLPYVRVLASGNKGIEACYDHSDGFYRRLIMLHCKEKGQRKDDKLLAKKIISNELSGILNWALIGLQRLIAQEWEFTISERSEGALRDAEESSNTFIPFIMDDTVVEYGLDKTVTSADLYLAYERLGADKAIKPLATRTVTTYLKENLTYYGIRYSNKIEGNKRGYVGIGLLSPVAKAGRFKIVQGGM
jgi:putative DNA primase/helicase